MVHLRDGELTNRDSAPTGPFLPRRQTRKIKEMGVYVCTGIASVLVYVWLVFILQVTSPEIIEPWEGLVTFCGFPVLVILAYLLDIGYFSKVGRYTCRHVHHYVHHYVCHYAYLLDASATSPRWAVTHRGCARFVR